MNEFDFSGALSFTLNSPLTDEDWDVIEDVDFDHTDNITFHTKHGKEVEFVKKKKGRWVLTSEGDTRCSECGHITEETLLTVEPYNGNELVVGSKGPKKGDPILSASKPNFCSKCGADMR